jgi:hypothetical protein
MVRLSAVYAPQDDADREAALVAAIHMAQELARDVLIFSGVHDPALARLGFDPVLDRVMLGQDAA